MGIQATSGRPKPLIWNGDGENPIPEETEAYAELVQSEHRPHEHHEEHTNLDVLAHGAHGAETQLTEAGVPVPELGQQGIDAITMANGVRNRDVGAIAEGGVPMAIEAMTHSPLLSQMGGYFVHWGRQAHELGLRNSLSLLSGGVIKPSGPHEGKPVKE